MAHTSEVMPTGVSREASGHDETDQPSPAPELVTQSLRNAHMPPAHDWQPDSAADSGDEADDEGDPFADFLEEPVNEEDGAWTRDIRTALEYLRGVLAAVKTQKPFATEDAADKTDDDMSVPAKDSDMDEEDDFVLVEAEDDDGELQDMAETCLDLINQLDHVMSPSVDAVDFLREEDMEMMLIDEDDYAVNGSAAASSSARVRSKWQLLYEKFYNDDNKVFKEADMEHWKREVVQACGDLMKDVSRRLHRPKNGC